MVALDRCKAGHPGGEESLPAACSKDCPGQHTGQCGATLLTKEEGLHQCRRAPQVLAQSVWPAGNRYQDGPLAGAKNRLYQLRLVSGQAHVRDIATLARRAAAEHARPVPDRKQHHIRSFSLRDGGLQSGEVATSNFATLLVTDFCRRELPTQRRQQRLRFDAEIALEVGVLREHVVREGIAAEERLGIVCARPDHRDPLRRLEGKHSGPALQQDDAGFGNAAGNGPVGRGVQVDDVAQIVRAPIEIEQAQVEQEFITLRT